MKQAFVYYQASTTDKLSYYDIRVCGPESLVRHLTRYDRLFLARLRRYKGLEFPVDIDNLFPDAVLKLTVKYPDKYMYSHIRSQKIIAPALFLDMNKSVNHCTFKLN